MRQNTQCLKIRTGGVDFRRFFCNEIFKVGKKSPLYIPFLGLKGAVRGTGIHKTQERICSTPPLLAQWISFTQCAPFKGVLTEYSIHAPSRGSRKARLRVLRGRAVWSWVHIYWRISIYKLIFGESPVAARAAHLLIIQYFCIQSLVFSVAVHWNLM